MSRTQQAVTLIKEDISGKKVLEAACGTADFSIEASKIAQSVNCIDLESFRLNPKITECPNIIFEKMDAAALSFEDGYFDTAVVYNALAHLETVLESVLSECLRVTRQGGRVCFISSFSIDKGVAEEKLIPLLENKKLKYQMNTDKVFTYIKITK